MIWLMAYLIFSIVAGCIVNQLKSNRIRKWYLRLIFITAFVYSGFRGPSVGRDTLPTLQIFDSIAVNGLAELPRNTEIEKGYMVLCFVLSRITANHQIILIVTSAIVCHAFYLIISKYSSNPMLSSAVFISCIFTVTLNVSRQYMALAFVLYALMFSLKKRKAETLIMLITAGMTHYTAFIFLPILLLSFRKFKFTRSKLVLVGGISVLAVPLYMSLVSLIISFLPQYARFLTSARYSASSEISYSFVAFLILILLLDAWSIIPARIRGRILIIQRGGAHAPINDERSEISVVNYMFTLLFIEYIVIYFIAAKLWIAGRLIYYFQMALIIVLPNMLDNLKKKCGHKSIILMITCFFLLYYVYFGYRYFINDPHEVLPYMFFWE